VTFQAPGLKPYILLPAAALLFAGGAAAASQDWANLKTVEPESEIRVNVTGSGTMHGALRNVTDGSLVIARNSTEESLERNSILRVEVKAKSHRARNALIGTAIGAGGGLAAGAGVDANACPHVNCLGGFKDIGKVALTPAGALVGLLVGALIPTGRWHEVYRAP